jgi:Protein of unknown function (DUF1565)
MKRYLPLFVPLLILLLTAATCNQSQSKPPSLSVTPTTLTITVGSSATTFKATLENTSGDVTWTLEPNLGTLSSTTGLEVTYTPPGNIPTQTNVVLTASLGNLSAKVTITVNPVQGSNPTISITPTTAILNAGDPAKTFIANVEKSNAPVQWTLSGEGSLSSESGLTTNYTPPASVSSLSQATLTATLENTSISASATITLQSATQTVLYVSAVNGSDTNPGSSSAPFKTLSKALSVASSGLTIKLQAGTYDASNGETYPETVPDGVSILVDNARNVFLIGKSTQDGLILAGSATLVGLDLQNFNTAIIATTGTQTLTNLAFNNNIRGLRLASNAQTTLNGNSSLANGKVGVALADTAKLVMEGGSIQDMTDAGAAAYASGIDVVGSASLELTNITIANNPAATLLALRDSASAAIKSSKFTGNGTGFFGGNTIVLLSSSSLELEDSEVRDNLKGTGIVLFDNSAALTIKGGCICTNKSNGIYSIGHVTLNGTLITGNGSGGIQIGGGTLDVTEAYVADNSDYGIHFNTRSSTTSSSLKVRKTYLRNSYIGLSINMKNTDSVDLGTSADPGNNVISNEALNLSIDKEAGGTVTVSAVGNTWDSSVQGADAAGHYPSSLVTGPVTTGKNYNLVTGVSLQF